MEIPTDVARRIDAIRADNTSGAAELAAEAADTLTLEVLAATEAGSVEEVRGLVESVALALVDAQPAMAPMVTLANRVLLAADAHDDADDLRDAVRATCRAYRQQLEQSRPAIAAAASDLIDDGATVLTYSYSSTVLHALLHANAAGTTLNVICSESRPVNEGVALAERLGREDISVRLVVDAATFAFLHEADLVLVGADTVTMAGVTNKIGTSALAQVAHAAGVDVYVLCSTAKFLPAGVSPHPPRQRPSSEILADPPPNVTPVNYYFDLSPAPLERFAGVVTEEGIVDVDEIERRLRDQEVHPLLRDR